MKTIRILTAAVALVTVAELIPTDGPVEATQTAGFTGIVGNWSNVNDGGAAFKVDTAGWSGQTPRATLESLSKSLFTSQSDTFITNGMAPQAFPIAVHNDTKDFTAGTIRVQFKMLGGTSDQNGGIVFNLKPNGEYFFVRYNTAEGNLALWRFRNGARARVQPGTANAQLPLNTWHELALTIAGNKMTATVNGDVLKLEYTLTEPTSGRVGLWTKRDAITVFRNFRVMP